MFASQVDEVYNKSKLIDQCFHTESIHAGKSMYSSEGYNAESVKDSVLSAMKVSFSSYFYIFKMFDEGAQEAANEAQTLISQLNALKTKKMGGKGSVSVSGDVHLGGIANGAELIKALIKYSQGIGGSKGASSVTTFADGLAEVTEIVRDTWFVSSEKQDARIDDIRQMSLRVFKESMFTNGNSRSIGGQSFEITHGLGGSKSVVSIVDGDEVKIKSGGINTQEGIDIQSLSDAEKDKLIELCINLCKSQQIETAMRNLVKKMQMLYGYTWVNNSLRLANWMGAFLTSSLWNLFRNATDLREAMSFTSMTEVFKDYMLKELAERNKALKAVVAYIQASAE